MNICFVYKEDYPWDVRVEKIVLALVEAGHEVTLLARNVKRRAGRERMDGFEVRRLPALPPWCGKLNSVASMPFFLNPMWYRSLRQCLRDIDAEVLIVRDLPLMPVGIQAARGLDCRVVFDMAECYPNMYRSILQFEGNRLANWLLKNPDLAASLERYSVRECDHVMVMVEESRDRLLAMGFDEAKVSIVSNTPPLLGKLPREHRAADELRLLYVGFVTRIRGLDTTLRGMRAYRDLQGDGPRVRFDVVGVGPARAELEALARELGIDDWVRFHGWCEQDTVDELYAASDVGVLTYRVCPHWNSTIPNKLFDYMLAGMPVLATNIIPIERIVDAEACGEVFPDGDAAACGEALQRLTDPEHRTKLGQEGHRAVLVRYNWDHDRARMLEIVKALDRRQRS